MARTWRIGEVAERTGLTRRTLRHYDDLGLLSASERSWGDYRLYTEADLVRLLQIQNLKALGLSLAEIADALGDPDLDASATLASHLEHLEERIADEQSLASRLRSLVDTPERSWEDVLGVIALTSRLAHPDPIIRLRAALTAAPRSTTELLDALANETDPAVQEILIWALTQQPDAAAGVLGRWPAADARLRALLVRALGKLGGPEVLPTLSEALAASDPEVVTSAVRALASLPAGQAAAAGVPLAALLGSSLVPSADLLDALVQVGPAALEPMAAALQSLDPATRQLAAEAIGRLGGGLSTELGAQSSTLLSSLLHDLDASVRMAALLALNELGEAGRDAILAVTEDPQLGAVARKLLDLHVT
ncbi:MAG TPA: MerR family transcriptional regulator [Propionicimonas sp.]|mgnify:CR=1 FL=1|nr:MerR family transcriptional regulator [Propionicimonas sp.]HQD96059.1 MerR family transcriptional regulator [Propionicimonas sp.]